MTTLHDRMNAQGASFTGFDYLRIGLSIAVLVWHSVWLSTGDRVVDVAIWTGPFRFLVAAIVPVFFALSGFLVAGSLARTTLPQFIALRALRLIPALAVEIALSVLVVGLAFTTLPRSAYLTDPRVYSYFLNIVGDIHVRLPGVFATNRGGVAVNGQLWTIPFEMECYAALAVLALTTVLRRRFAFAALVIGAVLVATVAAFTFAPIRQDAEVPGRALVVAFLAAVALYRHRDAIPYSNTLGAASAILGATLLLTPNGAYLSALPIAYMTVWLGLKRLPPIPFGDLSYGVYLFHYPIEQSLAHVFPGIHAWWMLSLVALPLTAACAFASWTFVERPILNRKKSVLLWIDGVSARVSAEAADEGERAREAFSRLRQRRFAIFRLLNRPLRSPTS